MKISLSNKIGLVVAGSLFILLTIMMIILLNRTNAKQTTPPHLLR